MEVYEYLETLCEGASTFVCKCVDRSTGKPVVVKGFKRANEEPEILRLAVRQVRMLQSLNHPAIIPLNEVFKSKSGRVYMVFPFVGRSTDHLLGEYPDGVPGPKLKLLTWQLLQALLYLHRRKVVHRDVTPSNLLMSETGQITLCGFGFARATDCGARDVHRFTSYVTSRWYRAPEVLVGDSYGPSCDIWSLGCTIAELATAKPLFPGNTSGEQLWRIMRCFGPLPDSQKARLAADRRLARVKVPVRSRSLHDRLKYCDAELLRLLESCLKLNPRHRPTAAELLQSPYFASVPQMISGTSLERVYSDMSIMRQAQQLRSRSSSLEQQQQQQQQVAQERLRLEQRGWQQPQQQRPEEVNEEAPEEDAVQICRNMSLSRLASGQVRGIIETAPATLSATVGKGGGMKATKEAERCQPPPPPLQQQQQQQRRLTRSASKGTSAMLSVLCTMDSIDWQDFAAKSGAAGTGAAAGTANSDLPTIAEGRAPQGVRAVPSGYDDMADAVAAAARQQMAEEESFSSVGLTSASNNMDVSYTTVLGAASQSHGRSASCSNSSTATLGSITGVSSGGGGGGGMYALLRGDAADGMYTLVPGNIVGAAEAEAESDGSDNDSVGIGSGEDDNPVHDRMFDSFVGTALNMLPCTQQDIVGGSTLLDLSNTSTAAVDEPDGASATAVAGACDGAFAAAPATAPVANFADESRFAASKLLLSTAPLPPPQLYLADHGGRSVTTTQVVNSMRTTQPGPADLRRLMTTDQLGAAAAVAVAAAAPRRVPKAQHRAYTEAVSPPQTSLGSASLSMLLSPQRQRLQPTEPRTARSSLRGSGSFLVPKKAPTDADPSQLLNSGFISVAPQGTAQLAQLPQAASPRPSSAFGSRRSGPVVQAWAAESEADAAGDNVGPAGAVPPGRGAAPAATASGGRGTGGGGGGAAPGSAPIGGAGSSEAGDLMPHTLERFDPTELAMVSRTNSRVGSRVFGSANSKVLPTSRIAVLPSATVPAPPPVSPSAAVSAQSAPAPLVYRSLSRSLVAAVVATSSNVSVSRCMGTEADATKGQILALRIPEGASSVEPPAALTHSPSQPSRRPPPLAHPSPLLAMGSASTPVRQQTMTDGQLYDERGRSHGSSIARPYVKWITSEYDGTASGAIDGTGPASKTNGKTKGALSRLFGAVKRAFTNPSKTATSPQ